MQTRTPNPLLNLAVSELAKIQRDSMLRWLAVMPLIFALSIRWLTPLIDANIEMDLRSYHTLIMSVQCIVLGPVLIGFMVGVLLLDERDDGTLQAVRVTPISLGSYLTLRMILPVLMTTLISVLSVPVAGLIDYRTNLIAACVVGSLFAPNVALLMAAFAKNKLQGFIIMRVSGIPIGGPLLAWFFDADPFFAWLPGYWPLKAFWLAAEGQSFWPFIVVGVIVNLACIHLLLKRFQSVISQS